MARVTKAATEPTEVVDIMADQMTIGAELDAMEKHLSLNQMGMSGSRNRESTGLLVLDLMLSGGTTPGAWTTFFGGEQSAKSTLASTVLNRAVMTKIPRIAYFDYEGSFQPDYFEAIARTMGNRMETTDIFGVRDTKGRYVSAPRFRYYSEQVAERFFDYLFKLELTLPDKLFRDDRWWYVFDPREKEHKDTRQRYADLLDKQLFTETGKVWVPAPDGRLQALLVVDSYPAMLPERYAEEDKNESMAAQANMFSTQLKRVKGKMLSKRISVMGVNQLRLKPGTVYGNPEYEPGGQAIAFYCFGKDTVLQTSVGQVTAQELYRTGTLPYTIATEHNSGETPSKFLYMGRKKCVRMFRSMTGTPLTTARNHRVLTLSGGDNPQIVWKAAKDICVGDRVPVKVGSNVWSASNASLTHLGPPLPSKMTDDFARVIGYLLTSGNYSDGELEATFRTAAALSRFVDVVTRVLPEGTDFTYHANDRHFVTKNPELYELLSRYNKFYTKDAYPLGAVRTSTRSVNIAFLEGFFDSSQWSPTETISSGYTSALVLSHIHQILLNLGVVSSVRNVGTYGSGFLFVGSEWAKLLMSIISIPDCHTGVDKRRQPQTPEYQKFPGFLDLKFTDINRGWLARTYDATRLSLSPKQRTRLFNKLENIRRIAEYTEDHNIVWDVVTHVANAGKQRTYDFNVPGSHTVLTSGVISHNSDVRIRMAARANPNGKGQLEAEPSVIGGEDTYRYVHMRAIKNKLSTPYLEGWARLWLKDSEMQPHGFDPVFDTYEFLRMTGLISGTKNRLKVNLPQMMDGGHKPMSWMMFKTLVLGQPEEVKDVLASIGVNQPFWLRNACFKLFKDGIAMDLFTKHQVSSGKKDGEAE